MRVSNDDSTGLLPVKMLMSLAVTPHSPGNGCGQGSVQSGSTSTFAWLQMTVLMEHS